MENQNSKNKDVDLHYYGLKTESPHGDLEPKIERAVRIIAHYSSDDDDDRTCSKYCPDYVCRLDPGCGCVQ